MKKVNTKKSKKADPLEQKKIDAQNEMLENMVVPPVPDCELLITIFAALNNQLHYKLNNLKIDVPGASNIFGSLNRSIEKELLKNEIMKRIVEDSDKLMRQAMADQGKKGQIISPHDGKPINSVPPKIG